MIYCCALRFWSQICITCRSFWFLDLVALSCDRAGCLWPEGCLHTCWMDTVNFANPNLSVAVANFCFLGFVLRDKTSMCSTGRGCRASFLFVGDFNGHQQKLLCSKSTNCHGVAALGFATVSCRTDPCMWWST